jgi:hypothetical protein
MLKKISELYDRANAEEGAKRIVIANAADDNSLDAVYRAK